MHLLARLAFAGLLALAPPALADTAPAPAASLFDAIAARGALRVGTTGDYRPFTYLDPQTHEFEGIDIDMARSLGKALGVKVEFVQTSWPKLASDFAEGKFDIAMGGVSINFERQKKGLFSTAYMVDGKAPIARCADQEKYRELADIDRPGVRVVVNPGGTNERFAREHLHQATVTVYPDNVTIFDQIVEGKEDVMITDAVETVLQHKLRPSLCAVRPDRPFNFSEKAYWMPRDFVLKAFVDQWLHQSIGSGEFRAIYDKWLK